MARKFEHRYNYACIVLKAVRVQYSWKVVALKKALRDAHDSDISTVSHRTPNAACLSKQMKHVSQQLNKIAGVTSDAQNALKSSEERRIQLQFDLEAAQVVNPARQDCFVDFSRQQGEVEVLERVVRDFKSPHNAETKLAGQLVTLSEELRAQKLAVLQSRRQIQVLREEKAHLESAIRQRDDQIFALEESSVNAESKIILVGQPKKATSEFDDILSGLGIEERAATPTLPKIVIPKEESRNEHLEGALHDDAVVRLEEQNRRVGELMREISGLKIEKEQHLAALQDLQYTVTERESSIRYYEDFITRHGLPTIAHALHDQKYRLKKINKSNERLICSVGFHEMPE